VLSAVQGAAEEVETQSLRNSVNDARQLRRSDGGYLTTIAGIEVNPSVKVEWSTRDLRRESAAAISRSN
jgi:hypothetical protein